MPILHTPTRGRYSCGPLKVLFGGLCKVCRANFKVSAEMRTCTNAWLVFAPLSSLPP